MREDHIKVGFWFALLCALMLYVTCGCATMTPRAKWITAVDSYNTTMHVLADCRRMGLIDNEQAADIERWWPIANRALVLWDMALTSGENPDDLICIFNEVMRELCRARIEALGRGG